MSDLVSKFESHIDVLFDAVEGGLDLRSNHRLYRKVHQFYKKDGVIFTGDTDVDYHMIISYLSEDLVNQR